MAVIVTRDVNLTALPGVFRDMATGITIGPGGIVFDRALKVVSTFLSGQAKANFDQQRAPDGTPWAKLKRPRNRKRDRAKNKLPSGAPQGGQKVLYDSGQLMGSMVGRGKGAQNFIRKLGPMSLEQGTNRDYAHFHQYGTRHMVKREISGITDKHADTIANLVADDVVRQLVGR